MLVNVRVLRIFAILISFLRSFARSETMLWPEDATHVLVKDESSDSPIFREWREARLTRYLYKVRDRRGSKFRHVFLRRDRLYKDEQIPVTSLPMGERVLVKVLVNAPGKIINLANEECSNECWLSGVVVANSTGSHTVAVNESCVPDTLVKELEFVRLNHEIRLHPGSPRFRSRVPEDWICRGKTVRLNLFYTKDDADDADPCRRYFPSVLDGFYYEAKARKSVAFTPGARPGTGFPSDVFVARVNETTFDKIVRDAAIEPFASTNNKFVLVRRDNVWMKGLVQRNLEIKGEMTVLLAETSELSSFRYEDIRLMDALVAHPCEPRDDGVFLGSPTFFAIVGGAVTVVVLVVVLVVFSFKRRARRREDAAAAAAAAVVLRDLPTNKHWDVFFSSDPRISHAYAVIDGELETPVGGQYETPGASPGPIYQEVETLDVGQDVGLVGGRVVKATVSNPYTKKQVDPYQIGSIHLLQDKDYSHVLRSSQENLAERINSTTKSRDDARTAESGYNRLADAGLQADAGDDFDYEFAEVVGRGKIDGPLEGGYGGEVFQGREDDNDSYKRFPFNGGNFVVDYQRRADDASPPESPVDLAENAPSPRYTPVARKTETI